MDSKKIGNARSGFAVHNYFTTGDIAIKDSKSIGKHTYMPDFVSSLFAIYGSSKNIFITSICSFE